ncbi:MAG: DUF1304 family protein [Candidatus Limnocylindrales bacterium]
MCFRAPRRAARRSASPYNGFLAAGLIVGLLAPEAAAFQFKAPFLACVMVAGLFVQSPCRGGSCWCSRSRQRQPSFPSCSSP